MMTKSLLAALGLLMAGPLQEGKTWKGSVPPELVGEKNHWVGSSGPLTLKELKGKVVWLEFGFIN